VQNELLQLLTDLAAERVALIERHEAGARVVSHYDFNNTYQYVIAREETHLGWLGTALTELGAAMPKASAALPVPAVGKITKKVEPTAFKAILDDDARTLGAFVQKWRPQLDAITHARHRTMLNVVMGESLEHQRLFAQAAGGFEDLLGKRTGGVARVGGVLPARWQE
jgi:Mn-containing catalase